MNSQPRRKAIFLDRDGTVTLEGEWIVHPGLLEIVPGAGRALLRLREAGFATVMYTNQSAVARGMINEAELASIHARLQALLAADGAAFDAIYYCPHHPTEGIGAYLRDCDCRKPKSGLIERAAREMDLDLAGSWCVGDMGRDLEAGERIGVPGILVATGKGAGEYARLSAAGKAPRWFEPDVNAAVDVILRQARDVRGPLPSAT